MGSPDEMKNNCPVCGRERVYKTKNGFIKGVDKPCRSCANSISAGGTGWSPFCFDCKVNLKDDKYSSLCRVCHIKRSKRYHKEIYRWSKYGLDGPIEMKECAICKTTNDLVIDHCHGSGEVRGILCRQCNLGIGSLQDREDLLENAYKYLKEFNWTSHKKS